MALSGVSSDGLSTAVQPVRSAGITFSTIWFIGQFQGVISPQTPMGSRSIVSPFGKTSRHFNRSKAARNPSRWPMPTSACCSRHMVAGAPSSSVIVSTISSYRRL